MIVFDVFMWVLAAIGILIVLFLILGLVLFGVFVYNVVKENIDWHKAN